MYAAALGHPSALREKGEGSGDSSGALWGLGTVARSAGVDGIENDDDEAARS